MSSSPVVLIVQRKPLSHQAGGRSRYQAALREEARTFVSEPLTDDRLYIKIYYFYRGKSMVDADNISKPIVDALKTVVYHDDSQVSLRLVAKTDLETDSYELDAQLMAPEHYDRLLELVSSRATEHILYIEVGTLGTIRLTSGVR